MDFMIKFGEETLGKGVVVCKDTPNFIANRYLSITNSYTIGYALDHGYTVEEVDGITGVLMGHPKTATFRLLDLVGIDVSAHVSNNLYGLIPDDESRETLKHEASTKLFTTLVERKWFGNKTKIGFSKRVTTDEGKREFWTLNLETLEHEKPKKPRFELFGKGRAIEDLGERFRWIVSQVDDPEASEETQRLAKFIWAITANAMGYAARRIPEIVDDLVNLDKAVRSGFVHEMGPFEIWDALGVEETIPRMTDEGIEIASWVKKMLKAGCPSFYQYEEGKAVGYYDLKNKGYRTLEVDPRLMPIATLKAKKDAILKRNASASLIDMGDGVGLIEFHSKANTLDQDIFEIISHALDVTEDGAFDALVLGNEGRHFSAGANIFVMWMAAQQGDFVIPGGTGTKEMLRRVVNPVMRIPNADPISVIQKVFEMIAMAKVATGAYEAFEFGFFQPGDRIIMNQGHLLAEAKRSALAMVQEGFKPPAQEMIYAAGRDVLAALRAAVWGLREAGWATEHDAVVANKLAWVLCGGDITEPTWVPEQYILDLEAQAFVELWKEEKTRARAGHMLEHNKPLRN
jgi:3-hydroxyacyl-CoA dehydrogenase